MRKTVSKIITFTLLAALCLPQNAPMSNAASKDTKKVLSAYASVLKKKKYINEQGDSSKPSFALADLNGDGISELIISSTDEFMSSKDYFMYKNGNAVKVKTPKYDFYPAFGTLYEMPSRHTYAYFRGGPACDDENGRGIMPYMICEYKLANGKIKLVNQYEKIEMTNRKYKNQDSFSLNGKKTSKNVYESVNSALENEIIFEANTAGNRQKNGVNNVIKVKKKKKTTTKKTKTEKVTPKKKSTKQTKPNKQTKPSLEIGNVRVGRDASTGKVKITWTKQKDTEGVILQYAKNSRFTDAKNVTITRSEWVFTNSVPFPCYVRIRPYAMNGGTKVLGAWIGVKLKK